MRRRTPLVVLAATAAALVLSVAFRAWLLPFRVVAVEYGHFHESRFGEFARTVGTVPADEAPVLWVDTNRQPAADGTTPRVEGRCGCAWNGELPAGGWGSAALFRGFPRRDPEIRLRWSDLESWTTFVNPLAPLPPASADGVRDLPVDVRSGDQTWVLAFEDRRFVVRGVDASLRPIRWTLGASVFRDAMGNEVRRPPAAAPAAQHTLWDPYADPVHHVCPHEPWTELEVTVAPGREVVFRFRPPR